MIARAGTPTGRFGRAILASAITAMICAGCLHKPKDVLFPATPGSTWTYSAHITGTSGGHKIDQIGTMVMTAVTLERSGAATTVVMGSTLNGKPMAEETYVVTDSEVARSRFGPGGSNTITPPLPILKMPAHPGMTWSWTGRVKIDGQAEIPAKANQRIVAHERLDTKAGKFDCFRVETRIIATSPGEKLEIPSIFWFRRDVGLVRQQAAIWLPGGEQMTLDAELTSYTIK